MSARLDAQRPVIFSICSGYRAPSTFDPGHSIPNLAEIAKGKLLR